MAGGRWRIASGLVLVPVAVAGVAGCGGSGGASAGATASASAAVAKAGAGLSGTELREALLTRVNGVAAAEPASSGSYSSLSAGASESTSGAKIMPQACAGAATSGFDPSALSGSPAAAVLFKVGSNGVSEVLIASSASSASTALSGQIPAQCATYDEKVAGKTFKYGVTEKAVTGIGKQAKVLNVHAIGSPDTDDLWSLIYTGKGFVGTITVVGPNASEQAVRELGQVAYGYAAKELP
jgi:hypothetical protein